MKICSLLLNAVVGTSLWFYSSLSSASIQVELQDPNWVFSLPSAHGQEANMQPRGNEHAFVKAMQPLLAQQKYSDVLAAFKQRPLENDSLALQLLRGQILLTLKKLPEAETALQAALQQGPNVASAHRSLSMAFMLQKKYGAAQKHLVRTIELGAADAQSYGQLAFVNLQQQHPYSAVAGYQQALLLQPDNSQWQQGLIYALTQAQAYQQAQALIEQMLERTPNDTSLWLLRSQVALQQQRNSDALSSLEVALRLGDKQVKNYTIAAQLHLQHGSTERAVILLSQSIQQLNKSNLDALLPNIEQTAAWLANQQRWSELNTLLKALEHHTQTIPTATASRLAVYHAQYALHHQQKSQALKWLNGAIAQDPSNGEALIGLAQLHNDNKSYEQATLYFVRAATFEEVRERALLGHAQLEIDREQYPQALTLLRKAFKHNPERRDIAGNIRALEKLVRHSDAG